MYSANFLIFRRISVTRQFLVSLTSIVGKKYTMEVNEIKNGKTQLFNSGGVIK